MNRVFVMIVMCCVFLTTAKAQLVSADSVALQGAFNKSLDVYHHALYPSTSFYNGARYHPYRFSFKEGHPYYLSSLIDTGYIVIDQVRHNRIPMLYDLVRQKVVVHTPSGDAVMLHSERIQSFYHQGYLFLNITKDTGLITAGFYAVLYNNKMQVLQARAKSVRDDVTSDGVMYYADEKIKTFVIKDSIIYAANNRKDLLRIFSDKSDEVRRFIRSNKLSFKNGNFEQSLVTLTNYYETLKR